MKSVALIGVLLLLPATSRAQHAAHASPANPPVLPTLAGQDAFAAIAEIAAILEADSSTDWSKVDLEAVRRHLVDMNNVVLKASSAVRHIPGGAVFTIDSPVEIRPAVLRMVTMHSIELNRMPEWRSTVRQVGGATQLTVVASSASDTRTMNRIRGLGFVGLLATGSHHQAHHLSIAKGAVDGHSMKH